MLKVTKVEQLKAEVERLTRERDEAEARMNEARGELIAAEREEQRNQKLTPAMLKVLTAMNEGASLHSSRWHLPESYWLEPNGQSSIPVRASVAQGLRSREAIIQGEREGPWRRVEYQLTEHGKRLCGPSLKEKE